MKPSHPIPAKFALMLSLTAALLFAPAVLRAAPQHTTALQPDATTPHRTRLILKDGSYQIVMSYKVVGKVVRYVSAERGGAEEEIPLDLVDMDATQRWERQHAEARSQQSRRSLTLPPSIPNSSRRRQIAPP